MYILTLPEVSPPQRLKSHTDLKVRPCCYQINQSQSQGECGRKLQTVKKYMYIYIHSIMSIFMGMQELNLYIKGIF